MEKQTILIVGINSFLGKALARLLRDKYTIVGVYHKNIDEPHLADAVFSTGNIDRIESESIKTVYLVSAYIPYITTDRDDHLLYGANVDLPLQVCRKFPYSRIVYCSTVSVYSEIIDGRLINDSISASTTSAYALSKLWGEQIIRKHEDFGIVRLSSIYGVGMNSHTFIPKIIGDAVNKGVITLLGDGRRLQNYIHVEDAAKILIAIGGDKTTNQVVLGVGNSSYSNLEIAQMISGETGCSIQFTGGDAGISYQYDNTEVASLLGKGYQFKDMTTGLKEIIAWKQKRF